MHYPVILLAFILSSFGIPTYNKYPNYGMNYSSVLRQNIIKHCHYLHIYLHAEFDETLETIKAAMEKFRMREGDKKTKNLVHMHKMVAPSLFKGRDKILEPTERKDSVEFRYASRFIDPANIDYSNLVGIKLTINYSDSETSFRTLAVLMNKCSQLELKSLKLDVRNYSKENLKKTFKIISHEYPGLQSFRLECRDENPKDIPFHFLDLPCLEEFSFETKEVEYFTDYSVRSLKKMLERHRPLDKKFGRLKVMNLQVPYVCSFEMILQLLKSIPKLNEHPVLEVFRLEVVEPRGRDYLGLEIDVTHQNFNDFKDFLKRNVRHVELRMNSYYEETNEEEFPENFSVYFQSIDYCDDNTEFIGGFKHKGDYNFHFEIDWPDFDGHMDAIVNNPVLENIGLVLDIKEGSLAEINSFDVFPFSQVKYLRINYLIKTPEKIGISELMKGVDSFLRRLHETAPLDEMRQLDVTFVLQINCPSTNRVKIESEPERSKSQSVERFLKGLKRYSKIKAKVFFESIPNF